MKNKSKLFIQISVNYDGIAEIRERVRDIFRIKYMNMATHIHVHNMNTHTSSHIHTQKLVSIGKP